MLPSSAPGPLPEYSDPGTGTQCILAIDQGTSSTRVILFDDQARQLTSASREHSQIFPTQGWVAHDPNEIWRITRTLLQEIAPQAEAYGKQIAGIGITNQRETTVIWDADTGEPIADAIVWQDTRTQPLIDALSAEINPHTGAPFGNERLRHITGLPLASYFSASKIRWLLDEIPNARERAELGKLRFGTMDSWLTFKLTGAHITDVTNASRTQLCDIHTLAWSTEALNMFTIPRSVLPRIVASSGLLAQVRYIPEVPCLEGVPVAGILGDQQAAAFGQAAFTPGEAKHTYGTGGFLMVNTGPEPVHSDQGLLTTVAYQLADEQPRYALEGSVAVAGSLHHWLRDNLGLFRESSEIEGLASSVPDAGGAFIVPAFSGLFAPRWQPDARGVIVGLTRFITKAHLVRAASEACAYQTVEVVMAAADSTGTPLTELRVDGGGSASEMMMQFQSDLLGIDVVRPELVETTACGVAFAAGLATGVWKSLDEIRELVREGKRWSPQMTSERRTLLLRLWNRAVERSLDWVDHDTRAL